MGKAARIKSKRGEFVRTPKQPTGVYRTAKDRQEARRRERDLSEKLIEGVRDRG